MRLLNCRLLCAVMFLSSASLWIGIESSLRADDAPAPKAAQEEQKSDAPAVPKEDEITNVDTADMDKPEGNWLKKRIWWQKAKEKYKQVRELFEQIFEERMNFLVKRSELDKTVFDPFYREMGFELSDVKELIARLLDRVESEQDETGYADEKERELLDKINACKKELEQLRLDIDAINEIDQAVENAISVLSGKINEAQKFERGAWDEFDAISQDLSDQKAMERYYTIDGIHKNLKELQNYIKNEYATFFQGLVTSAQEKTTRCKEALKKLSDNGLDLKEQAKFLDDEDDDESEEEQAAQAAAKAAQEEAAQKKAQEAARVGFFARIWLAIIWFLKSIWNLLFGWWLYRL